MADYARSYPKLFSPWQLRHTRITNRVVFGPVCPTWVRNAHEGIFTDQLSPTTKSAPVPGWE